MQTCSEKSPLFCEQQLGVGCTLQALGFQILCQGTALFSFLHNAVNQEINDMRKKRKRKKSLLGWRRRGVVVRRCQTKSVAKQHMHLRADLVNGWLRADCGGVWAAMSFHPQAAVAGASRSSSVTQRAHQTVHIGLLKWFWFTLQSPNTLSEKAGCIH